MSIRPDGWIARQCKLPTHVTEHEGKILKIFIPRDLDELEVLTMLGKRGVTVRPATMEDLKLWKPMISPFKDELVRYEPYKTIGMEDGERAQRRVISYGVSSYGYDVQLAEHQLKLFTNMHGALIDPRKMSDECFVDAVIRTDEDGCRFTILPPNSYLLGYTIEYFRIPRNVLVTCLGKSTYARAGVAVNVTPIEPEFEGTVVIEIANQTNLPVKIYVNQGIAQFLFFASDEACQISYKDRDGKYQGQVGLVHAKV